MSSKKSDTNQKLPIVIFLIFAVFIIVFCFLMNNALNNSEVKETAEPENTEIVTEADVTETVTEITLAETTEITEEDESAEMVSSVSETEPPVNPSRIAWEDDTAEVAFSDVVLDKTTEENKTYKVDLSRFVSEGDKIDSFRFVFHSEDGVSPLGEVKGGFGISVDNSCEARTDDIWYQTPDDFTVQTDESTCEVEWKVPDEIKDHIIVTGGQVLFGYWWSNSDRIVLDKIICSHKNMKILPDEASSSN